MTNILFLGRKKWAVYALEHLLDSGYTIIGVIGMEGFVGEDKVALFDRAASLGIPVYNFKEMYHFIDSDNQTFDGQRVDIIISYLFYKRIKKELLNTAETAINFHPAILPDYQGLGGYNAAILEEKREYGVSAHLMTEAFDAGDIIKISRFKISVDETALSLEKKSMKVMLDLFKEVFSKRYQHYIKHAFFNDVMAGRYITKGELEAMKYVAPDASKEEIDRKIRAFWYPPYEGAKVKWGTEYYTLINQHLLSPLAQNECSQEDVLDE